MTFLTEMDPATGLLDSVAVRDKGKELAAEYNSAHPFPHTVIEDFLPRPVIDMCLAEFSKDHDALSGMYDRAQERLKQEYKPDQMSAGPRNLFYTFNSRPFIRMLQNITGIKGLIPDPYFMGGGFHEIHNGGHLSIHADFNHHQMMNLERRINVLIYLNEDWHDDYGGQLELWDDDMTQCVKSILPEVNRCVIFNTTSNSNHGNPHPINHPDGRSRKSIALYYYTATWDDSRRGHSTQFRPRRGTGDRVDWLARRNELIEDLLPPLFLRTTARTKRAFNRILNRNTV